MSAFYELLADRSRIERRLFWPVVVTAAFALRLHDLTASGFWFDEAASHYIASKGLQGILDYARLAPGEHPPLYYWLLLPWMEAAGTSEFAMRFFSLWFGVLFVPLFYRFARRHFDGRLALTATLLTVPLPYLITYSQEARMYSLVMCCSLLAADYFLRWVRAERGAAWRHLAFLILAIGVHYYAVLLLAAEDVYLLTRRDLWRRVGLKMVLFHATLGGALALWFFSGKGPLTSVGLAFRNPLFAGRSFDETARIAVDLVLGVVTIRPLDAADRLLAVTAWLVALLGALWAHRRLDRWSRGEPLRAWLFAVAMVPIFLAAVVPYVYAARYLFVTLPAWILILACGLLALGERGRRAFGAGLAALLVVAAYGLNVNYEFVKSPYREMATIVTEQARPDDGIIYHGQGQWALALYYLRGPWQREYLPQRADAAELVDIDAGMRSMAQSHQRLWVLSEQAVISDPGNNVPRWLALNAYPLSRYWFKNGQAVALYGSGKNTMRRSPLTLRFGEWLELEQAGLSSNTLNPGGWLAVELRWHALRPIPQPLQLLMTLRLLDAQGVLVQERISKPCDGFCAIDDWVPNEPVNDRHGLIVPADTPAGDYRLWLGVWSPRQAQFLPAGAPGAEGIELGRVRVEPGGSR